MKETFSKKIKENLFKLYTIRALKKNDRKVENPGFKNAIHIGVIYKYSSVFQPNVINFIKTLQKYNGKVEAICFVEEGQKDFNYQCPPFSYKDVNILGAILDAEIKKFVNTTYDYLFYIDFNANRIIKYLIAKSKAKCKIGFYNKDFSSLLDLMVNFDIKEDTAPNKDILTSNDKQILETQSKTSEGVISNDVDLQDKITLLKELLRCVEVV